MRLNYAVLPARSGSKRVIGKNIREINGKPSIAWPIETAIESGIFEEVFVSTDSNEIAEIAKNFGAKVPFIRDFNLADDFTGTDAVIHDAIGKAKIPLGSNICAIYPTACLITTTHLIKSSQMLEQFPESLILAVSKYRHPIQRAFEMSHNLTIQYLNTAFVSTRTQDLQPTYYDLGQFYWGKVETWAKQNSPNKPEMKGFLLGDNELLDIDSLDDFKLVGELLSIRRGSGTQ